MKDPKEHLRDLIANAIFKDSFGLTTRSAVDRQADAVIAALGLRPEFREGNWLLNGQFIPPASRYVSEWVTGDE